MTESIVSNQLLGMVMVSLIGAGGVLGLWCLAAWLVKGKPEILPPPDRSARRLYLEEWEDTQ
jgi:hypothetical protein